MYMLNMGATLLTIILTAVLSTIANNISEQCQVHNETGITCRCIGNEKFVLPEEYNYTNITSVSISGCVSAYLYYSSLPEATNLREMIIQNISDRLEFDVYITSKLMKRLKLSNIGRIPMIARHTFVSVTNIETIDIENTRIDVLEEDFSSLKLFKFILTNVTIERVNKLNLSDSIVLLKILRILRIANTELRNISTSMNFANFWKVEIVDSMFVLQKPGMLLIDSEEVVVERSVFTNMSINVVANDFIRINGICADGKSALRLATYFNNTLITLINSTNNRLPTEIAYPSPEIEKWRVIFKQNNTVCKAGNCECPKGRGQGSQMCVSILILGCLSIVSLSRSFF